MTRRVEIGSERTGTYAPGVETLDVVPGADHCARWGAEPLPFADASFADVYASHVLEHVPWFQTQDALREVRRILAPGGRFEVWVPDFRHIVACYLAGRCGDTWRRSNPTSNPMLWANGRIFTYGPGEENWHRAVFDEAYLTHCLAEAGFSAVEITRERRRGVGHGPIDLGAVAYA